MDGSDEEPAQSGHGGQGAGLCPGNACGEGTPRGKRLEKHDAALTPHLRAASHPEIRKRPVITMNAKLNLLKPAALARQILALTGQLETLAQAKAAPRDYKVNTWFNPPPNRTFPREATGSQSAVCLIRTQGPIR